MRKHLSEKSEKVIKEMVEERLFEDPLLLMAREGARLMLCVAMEEKIQRS